MKKAQLIFLNAIPILIMMGLIPFVQNEYYLTFLYVGVILISFLIKKAKGDTTVFLFGFIVMIIAETIFVSTGVETFTRNGLFGLMPIWLPLLWGYSFVAMRRGLKILDM